MDQREFLTQLAEELKYLKPKDQNEVIKFYQQKINTAIDYGEKEEKVIASFPSPKAIAEDIYKTKGVAYIELRKKAMKRQAIINFITSIVVSLIILAIFAYITFIFGSMSVNLIKLLTQTNKFELLDQISLIISGILLLIVELVIFIYFVDLCYLIIMYFITGSYQQLKKKAINEKIANFSISGTINKLFKKEKVLVKIAIVVFFILIGSAVLNITTKGYLYRSNNNINSITEEYEVTENNLEKIVYKGSTANFTITTDDTIDNILITYYHELEHNFNLKTENNVLTIEFDDNKTYDFLDLLKEPTQTVVIKLPSKYNYIDLDLAISIGNVNILSSNLGDVSLTTTTGGYQIYNSNIESLTINTNKGTLITSTEEEAYKNTSNNIKNISINVLEGNINIHNTKGEKLNIINSSANIDIKNIEFTNPLFNDKNENIPNVNLSSNSGKMTINRMNCYSFNYYSTSTITTMYESDMSLCTVSAQATSSFTITKTIIKDKLDAFVSGSYFICEYVKSNNIKLEGNSGNIYLYNLSENIPDKKGNPLEDVELNEFEKEFNKIQLYPVITVYNKLSTKFAVENDLPNDENPYGLQSSIKSLTVTGQEKGSVILKDTKIETISMITNNAIIDMENVYGNDYYVKMQDGQLAYYNIESTNQEIKIERNMSALVEVGNNITKVE